LRRRRELIFIVVFVFRCDLEELPFDDLVPLFNKVFKFIGKRGERG
jgi:hypothetical protein